MARSSYHYSIGVFVLMMLPAGWGIASEIKSAKFPDGDNQTGPRITISGEIEQSINAVVNYDLDDGNKEGTLSLEPTIEFAITYAASQNSYAYLNLQYGRELEIEEENSERTYKPTLEIDEGFVQFSNLFKIDNVIKKTSLTVGRFSFGDKREWYYDKSLDGILMSFELAPIDTEFSLSFNREELIGSDLLRHNDFDPVNNIIVVAEHKPFKDIDLKFSAFAIVRDDRSADNESPRLYGLSSNGKLADKRFRYWTEFALARGKGDSQKIKGYGFDVGATMSFDKDFGPYLTLGYAFGSGDGNTDSDFRQTDLQGNSDKFGGVTAIKYYGELLDPELSNLQIFTAGFGFRFSRTASVDFVLHHYRQDVALDELRSSNLDIDPNGIDTELGNEWDIVFGYGLSSNVETEFILGYFWPGTAFDDDADDAFLVDAKITYNF